MRPKNKVVVKDNRLVSSKLGGNSSNGKVITNKQINKSDMDEQVANFFGGGLGGIQGTRNSTSISAIGTGTTRNLDKMLSGFVDDRNTYQLRELYRDIYYYDAVCGGAADMTSTLPFSDFSLTGLDDKKLEVFYCAVDQLNLKTQFPSFSLGYLVDGEYIGTLVVKDKTFTDILPHDVQDCDIQQLPFVSQDPMITVSKSETLQTFLNSEDPHVKKQRANYPRKMLEALSESEFSLDPLTTLYLARKTINEEVTSYFKRVLPWYLIEKTLLRGTIVEAAKRQRSALHVAAGGDTWEPTPEELSAIVSLFQQADFDPLGPTIATRNDIQIAEIRQGGDFWKITDIIDVTNQLKMRALSISDAFLSGEVTYNTSEVSLSVFIENIRTYRDYLTQQTFYRKMFPVIAHLNGFTKKREETATSLSYKINNSTMYDIPQVRWHKSLHPHSDKDTMEMLNTLAEKGVPVTLRMYAAAGGVDLDSIINELDQDKKVKEKIKELTGEDTSGQEEDVFASLKNPIKRVGFLNRDYGDLSEITGVDKSGKKKWIYNQLEANRKANENIAKALKELSNPHHHQKVRNKVIGRLNGRRR